MTDIKNMYDNGKIYTIRSHLTDKYYIGSTCNPLYKRLGQHKGDYKKFLGGKKNNISSFDIIKLGDAYIELLETYKCNSKEALNKREGDLMREHKDNIVNKKIAGRTNKEYREDNKEKFNEIYKQRYIDNREQTLEKSKQYRDNNKEKMLEKAKQYRDNNKEKIKESIKKKIVCECGIEYTKVKKARHILTKKHLSKLNI